MPVAVNVSVSFAPVEIDITLGDLVVTVPALPASVWLPILTDPELDGMNIFPGLLSGRDQNQIDDLIFAGELDLEGLREIIFSVITETGGHPWWWCLNLLSVLRGQNATYVLGEMTRLDATKVSLACWLNALYALLTRHQKMEDRVRLDAELEMPPPGVDLEISEVDEKASSAAFMSMMRQSNS